MMANKDNADNPNLRNILFLFSAGSSKKSPDAKPASIMPSHGTRGYAVKTENPGVICIMKGWNNIDDKNTAIGFAGIEIPCNKLWLNIIRSPKIPIVCDGNFNRNERTIKLNPIAEMTSMIINRK
jgi:hypothetical protein